MALSANEQQDQDRSQLPTQTVTNTAIGNLIAKCCITNQSLTIPQYVTLNERYGILADTSIGVKNGRDFELKYFGLGIRGSNCTGMDGMGVSIMRVNQHQPIDAELFTPIPLVARTLDADLDNVLRENYRIRVVQKVNNVDYVFYFLKLINFANYNPQIVKVTRDEETGNETVKPYVPNKDDLFDPEPVQMTSSDTVPVSNVYVNSSAILDCSLSEADIEELKNACKIMFGDSAYAAPSEVGIAYGIDTTTSGEIAGGASIQYTEALSAIFAHYVTERDARNANNNTSINYAFDHGASEPMLLADGSSAVSG